MHEKKDKIGLLPRLALFRPVTVVMTLLALMVVGFIAYKQIPVELMPAGFSPPFLGVWIPYPNANPEEVEQFIARPIEEHVRTLKGVKSVETNSFTNGCWAFVRFVQGTDMDLAYSQLRDRLDRAKADLPEDVERIFIRKWSNDDEPIMWVALIPEKPLDDPYYFTEQIIKKPLERIDGVASVEIWGAEQKSILIYINQDAIKSYKINLYNVIESLRQDNFSMSSGYIRTGGQKIYVRTIGKFRSLDDIRNIPIKGTNIFLKDVAEVIYDVPERQWIQRIDGQAAIQVGIYKEAMANTVKLCRQIEGRLNELLNDTRLTGFKMEVLFNQGHFIEESVNNLQKAGIWGGFFAFLVLYFFLRRFRMTMIVIVAIPLSILISLTIIYFIGWSMNLITMMGLMISIGMVVDNSIVVLENIYHKKEQGLDMKAAAAKGASEVSLAVTMATLTTVVVFLPLILMNDDVGFRFYMLRIGLPVIFSLLASLFVALVFIPLAASRIVSRRQVSEPPIIGRLNGYYQSTLRWVLTHRIESFLILMAILYSMTFAASRVGQTDNMEGNINDFRLMVDMPDNYTLEDAERVIKAVEDTIRAKAEVYKVRTIDVRYRQNFGRIHVFLVPEENEEWYEVIFRSLLSMFAGNDGNRMSRDEVVADVKKRLPQFAGVKYRTSWRQEGGDEAASVTVSLYGDDTRKLAQLAKEVERRISAIPEIISVETDQEKGQNEVHIIINREQARKYGISPRVITGTIMYALRGIQLPKFQTDEKEVAMLLQLREEDRENFEQLKNITFFSANGREIPLAVLAKLEVTKGFGEIHRENGKTYLSVKANTTSKDIAAVYAKIDQVMSGFKMPYGYSWSKGKRFFRLTESNQNMMFAIILSITFVFLLMGILFESFVLPLSVIVSIPFSFVGAFWILYLTDTPQDMMSQIGFIILIGIVVNNAIVLVDLVNRLRKQGKDRLTALIEGGRNRFRPILMTAFTTIGGLIPMAVGNTKMIGIPYAPMGRTIIGGLIFSTLVSLIAVPWAYTVFDDLRNYFKQLSLGILKSGAKVKAVEEGS
ncbi:efflux RND transporter permease subunit [Caldithrix abyssi]